MREELIRSKGAPDIALILGFGRRLQERTVITKDGEFALAPWAQQARRRTDTMGLGRQVRVQTELAAADRANRQQHRLSQAQIRSRGRRAAIASDSCIAGELVEVDDHVVSVGSTVQEYANQRFII